MCVVRARDLILLWCELLCTRLLVVSLWLEISFSLCPSFLSVLSESCCIWNIFYSRSTLLLYFLCMCFYVFCPVCFCTIYVLLNYYPYGQVFRWVGYYLYFFMYVLMTCPLFVVMGDSLFILLCSWDDLHLEVMFILMFALVAMYCLRFDGI